MNLTATDPPRPFICGVEDAVTMYDTGHLALADNEQVTFTTTAGGEYDVARKSWGFYATPSLNGRLLRFGLHAALVRNTKQQWFVMLVEDGGEAEFEAYLDSERLEVVAWLDSTERLAALEHALGVEVA